MALCPYCNKNQSADRSSPEGRKAWPFCSLRCKAADLGAWAKEEYAIPAVEIEEEDLRQLEEAGEASLSDEDKEDLH